MLVCERRKAMKKIITAIMVLIVGTSLVFAGGNSESESSVSISMLNSKGEIQVALEEMAKKFEEDTGIKLEVIACGAGEVPYTRITSMYNSGTAPTMAILDPLDINSLAQEGYCLDLSDSDWIQYCSPMTVNGLVYSFPFCIEGRGMIYNETVLEEVLGREFDPDSINSYSSFKALLEELRAKGMEYPVVVSNPDWSLGAHLLAYIYDAYDGTTEGGAEITAALASGDVEVATYKRFVEFTDTFTLLKEYNYNHADPLGAIYERDPMTLVDGDAALWFNGCWAWPNLSQMGALDTDSYGFFSFPLGEEQDFNNTGLQASASKQLMIDARQATAEEQAAAKTFIDWLVNDEDGQRMLVEDCNLIPACTNNTVESVDPLSKSLRGYITEGRTYSASTILPSDHWSVLGASMQRYLADQIDTAGLAEEVQDYWRSQN